MKRPTTYIKGNRCLLRQLAMRGLLNVRQGSKKHRFITKGAREFGHLPVSQANTFYASENDTAKIQKYLNY